MHQLAGKSPFILPNVPLPHFFSFFCLPLPIVLTNGPRAALILYQADIKVWSYWFSCASERLFGSMVVVGPLIALTDCSPRDHYALFVLSWLFHASETAELMRATLVARWLKWFWLVRQKRLQVSNIAYGDFGHFCFGSIRPCHIGNVWL